MTEHRRNAWDILTVGLWTLFFAAGLAPERVFQIFRTIAAVSSQRAFVNSSSVITVGFAIYLGFFVRNRCRDSGLSPSESQAHAIQISLIALLAFLEVPSRTGAYDSRTFLEFLIYFREIPDRYVRNVVLFVGAIKLTAWWYLFSLVLRYHLFGNRNVFAHMIPLIPSARVADTTAAEEQPPTSFENEPGATPSTEEEVG